MIRLEIENLGRRFGRREVFSGIDAALGAGESLVVAGPNGSGKSTLLRILAGLLRPSAGTVRFTVDGIAMDESARRAAIGYVAPDFALYRELTGVENLEFFARLRGVSVDLDSLRAILGSVGLKGRGRELVGNYSSGMRQRLKYAFALMHSPPVLLLDEPTANLDAQGLEMVEEIVVEQKRRGLLIIATNESRELSWGDSIVRLSPA